MTLLCDIGPLFDGEPQASTPGVGPYGGKVFGSCVIWSAESREDVLETAREDVYVEKGVWDFEEVKRTFLTALPLSS